MLFYFEGSRVTSCLTLSDFIIRSIFSFGDVTLLYGLNYISWQITLSQHVAHKIIMKTANLIPALVMFSSAVCYSFISFKPPEGHFLIKLHVMTLLAYIKYCKWTVEI